MAASTAAGDSLTRDARRLLTALAQPETWAIVDPTEPSSVLVHRRRSGISVGAGRFASTVAEALVRQDLGRWEQAASGRKALRLTKAGEACLRRASAPEADMAFFHQHRETELASVETDSGAARVRVDADESPLDWLRRRKGRDGEPMIDQASYQAGERLRTDIMLAGLLPGVTARWDGMPRSGGPASPGEATDRMVAARQRLRNAFDALGGDFSDLLLDLCGFLKGLEQIERERQWPARSAKIVVRLALTRLAEHYGIEASAQGPAASRGIRAWQAVVIDGGKV
ncbi:ATPase [Microvirga sp. Marseille-Q2068]|uniref:ATPase n=1 Tax=Microvirga mediterraneensis TaxID=2754695 RepID=A0A838BRB3_9HYPH|nr:ATPase [Microvirga mediterraneensis]